MSTVRQPDLAEVNVTISNADDVAEDAMRLVHAGFVEQGYMRPNPSGCRFLPHYLHEGTTFMVASIGGRPAGTMIVVPDGPFGLPSDRSHVEELDALRARGITPVEVSGLCVAREWRPRTRHLFCYLAASVVRIIDEIAKDHSIIFTVAPNQVRFYGSAVGTEQLGEDAPLYGAPASLVATTRGRVLAGAEVGHSPAARLIGRLILDGGPEWFRDAREPSAWDEEWLESLLREIGVPGRIGAQARLLAQATGAHDPGSHLVAA